MNELKRLDNELDFSDAATPQFHIPLQRIRPCYFAFDSAFDLRNLIEQIGSRGARIDEWLMLA